MHLSSGFRALLEYRQDEGVVVTVRQVKAGHGSLGDVGLVRLSLPEAFPDHQLPKEDHRPRSQAWGTGYKQVSYTAFMSQFCVKWFCSMSSNMMCRNAACVTRD